MIHKSKIRDLIPWFLKFTMPKYDTIVKNSTSNIDSFVKKIFIILPVAKILIVPLRKEDVVFVFFQKKKDKL